MLILSTLVLAQSVRATGERLCLLCPVDFTTRVCPQPPERGLLFVFQLPVIKLGSVCSQPQP